VARDELLREKIDACPKQAISLYELRDVPSQSQIRANLSTLVDSLSRRRLGFLDAGGALGIGQGLFGAGIFVGAPGGRVLQSVGEVN
jgi:hypothetical protein